MSGVLRRKVFAGAASLAAVVVLVAVCSSAMAATRALVSSGLARRASGLITAAGVEPTCGTGALVSVDLGRRGASLGLWVNDGRRQAVGGGAQRQFTVSADQGLRPGRNVIVLRAVDARTGTYTTRRLTVMMPSNLPVAGAGASQRSQAGSLVRFSASASVAPESSPGLSYRWMVVAHPRGSTARLRGAGTVRPSLRPDRPGRYVVRVIVSAVGAPAGPVAGLGRVGLLCAARFASAMTSVSATVASSAIGVSIDTIATRTTESGPQRGVQVGDPGAPGSEFYAEPDQAGDLQLLVLDRSTLALVDNQAFANNEGGAAAVVQAIKTFPNSDLVVLTRPEQKVTNSGADASAATSINQALAAIGVDGLPAKVTTGTGCQVGQCSAFSAIGIPGLPVGQGQVNSGLAGVASSDTPSGDLRGYLREDLTGTNFTFVNDERVPLDTGAAEADPAVVTIGSDEPGSEVPKRTYTSDHLDGPGFFVLLLDGGSLALREQDTYSADAGGLTQMAAELNALARLDPGGLVIVRSVGAVTRTSAALDPTQVPWDSIAGALEQLGGSSNYFDALNGSTSRQYAQVGPVGWPSYPNPWTKVASHESTGTGRLNGLLARNTSSQFYLNDSYPQLNDPDRPLAGSMAGLVSLPASAWPDRDTPGDQHVLDCIADHVVAGGLRTPIESNYVNQNINWGDLESKIENGYQTYSGFSDCAAFTQDDYQAVAGQLEQEWTDVDTVRNMIHNIQVALLGSQGNAADVNAITANINQNVGSGSQNVRIQALKIGSDLFSLAGVVPGLEELSAVSGLITLASDLDVRSDGSSALTDITTTGADLGATLAERYTSNINGISALGDILVSDWTKLQTAAANARDSRTAPADWAWTTAQAKQASNGLLFATRQLAYKTLFPARFKLYRMMTGTGQPDPEILTYPCADAGKLGQWHPFKALPPYDAVEPVHVSGAGIETWAYAGPDLRFVTQPAYSPQYPAANVLTQMFKDPQTDLGSSAPLFGQLQFPLEAYQNATSGVIAVTHISDHSGAYPTDYVCHIL